MTRFYSLTDDTDWQRRLQRGKARHLPIQAGEVAEYPRSKTAGGVILAMLCGMAFAALLIVFEDLGRHEAPGRTPSATVASLHPSIEERTAP